MVPELLCSTRPPRPKPQPDPGWGAGVPCSQSRAAQPPGQGAGLAAGASLGWRPQGEWVPRLPPGEEVGLWGGSEGWRGGTQVGRFPGQGAKQICV